MCYNLHCIFYTIKLEYYFLTVALEKCDTFYKFNTYISYKNLLSFFVLDYLKSIYYPLSYMLSLFSDNLLEFLFMFTLFCLRLIGNIIVSTTYFVFPLIVHGLTVSGIVSKVSLYHIFQYNLDKERRRVFFL